ncbi:hypothetical protein [Bacillus sp. 2205SS5-2]|uniref:hypothetical protein n=1 Tax=Bacillus sp. 2205SS5-2 TaxID=3109031 RepID=UPI003006FEBE
MPELERVIYSLVISATIVLLFSLMMSIIFKGKEKVDKGFVMNFFKLTHRKKMIRTIYTLPINIICLAIIYNLIDIRLSLIISLIVFIQLAWFLQLIYHYKMWKKEEKVN